MDRSTVDRWSEGKTKPLEITGKTLKGKCVLKKLGQVNFLVGIAGSSPGEPALGKILFCVSYRRMTGDEALKMYPRPSRGRAAVLPSLLFGG